MLNLIKKSLFGILLIFVMTNAVQAAEDHNFVLHDGFIGLQKVLPAGTISLANLEQGNVSTTLPEQDRLEASEAVSKVLPSVVTIFGLHKVTEPISTSSNGESSLTSKYVVKTSVTTGTGFFVTSNGYIITNKHVVSGKKGRYSVVLPDGSERIAQVVYRDPENDIAVLKIKGQNYQAVEFGNTLDLKVGSAVLDIGNPHSRDKDLVSFGSVTGLDKDVVAFDAANNSEEALTDVIQINTKLYPGDSGGPLFDYDGKVIGMNVAAAKNVENVGFSIPVEKVQEALNQAFASTD